MRELLAALLKPHNLFNNWLDGLSLSTQLIILLSCIIALILGVIMGGWLAAIVVFTLVVVGASKVAWELGYGKNVSP